MLRESKDKNRQVKMKDSHGYAPGHYAAKFNRPEIMQILVDDGAGMIIEFYKNHVVLGLYF